MFARRGCALPNLARDLRAEGGWRWWWGRETRCRKHFEQGTDAKGSNDSAADVGFALGLGALVLLGASSFLFSPVRQLGKFSED